MSLTAPTRRHFTRVAITLATAVIVGLVVWFVTQSLSLAPNLDRARGASATDGDGIIDASDGLLPADRPTTVFDAALPAISKLDPALRQALQRAAQQAAAEGVSFEVNSGWRSAEYQRKLLRDAVTTYGSAEEAAKWVSTPETSAHVSGDAIDLGPFDATYWLSLNGAQFDLCQIYGNESWHFELRDGASDKGCPPMLLDPTHDNG